VLRLDEIRRALADHEPDLEPEWLPDGSRKKRAAVAMLLREVAPGAGDGSRVEVLLIERARFAGDPWSGHMALPGGRVERDDEDARAAAERETLEEVGISLHGAEMLGRLDDLRGRHAGREIPMVISGFVYRVSRPPPPEPNYEVASVFWFPLESLREPARRDHYEVRGLRFPGIRVGEAAPHVVWGLTYRFLEGFFRALDRPLPDRWDEIAGDGSEASVERLERRLLQD
jgi:8-oxo-dGTP pyrophosphatase MutT (NUDIX family)